jgi:hypothetical protein
MMNSNFSSYFLNNTRNRRTRHPILNEISDTTIEEIRNFFQDPFRETLQENTIQQLNRISTLDILQDFLYSFEDYLSINDIEETYEELQEYTTENNVKVVVPEEDIKKLKQKLYEKETCKNENCAICLEDFKEFERVKILECKHNFHPDCIDPWLKKYSNKCPLCRDENKSKKYI